MPAARRTRRAKRPSARSCKHGSAQASAVTPWGERPPTPEKGMTMAIGLIVGIVFCAAVLFFQHKNKDDDDDEK